MSRSFLSVVAAALLLPLSASSASKPAAPPDHRAEVQGFVKAYVEAANKADVTAMMEMYSRGSSVTSVGDGDITRGWDAIRAESDQMVGKEGSYKISIGAIDVVPLGSSYALVVAPYTVTVTVGEAAVQLPGAMSLVVEKAGPKWLIVHDHMSTRAVQE